MEIKILSEKENLLLKRREVYFQVEHTQTGSTPSRQEIRKALAEALKKDPNLVFVRKFKTETGMHMALGTANIYDLAEQAKHVEPEYIVKRNFPSEKPKEEGKSDKS